MIKLAHSEYFFTKDGVRLFYQHTLAPKDKRTPILFNYGLVCSQSHYVHQINFFLKQNHPIVLHDYRGHYSSTGIEDLKKITIHQIATDVKDLMAHLKVPEAYMVGHSMGVNVTLEIAKEYPSFVKKMALISGTVISPHDIMFNSNLMEFLVPLVKAFASNLPTLFTRFWKEAYMSPLVRNLIKSSGFNAHIIPDEVVQHYLKKIAELSPDLFFQLLDEMKKHDIITFLPHIKTSALVIAGTHDKVIPLQYQKLIADTLPNSELVLIKEGSHVPQHDFPDEINKRLNKFFLL